MADRAQSGSGVAGPFHGPNLGYVLDLYDRYLADPNAVDAGTRAFFAGWTPPSAADGRGGFTPASVTPANIEGVLAAAAYAQAIRAHGHRRANLAPVGFSLADAHSDATAPALQAAAHGIADAQLATLPASVVGGPAARGATSALEAIERLRAVYCGTIGYEYEHVQRDAERRWLRDAAESGRFRQALSATDKRALLERLTAVEAFERFLHQAFLGAKRFSIEGADTLVPALDVIISGAAAAGIHEVVIGMAHRGRLNVLAHVLGKPYEAIIGEFSHGKRHGASASDSSDPGWTGDVKYHLGARRRGRKGQVVEVAVSMSPNPSHLEYVNPVVEGMARAAQDARDRAGAPRQRPEVALAIVLHGDAAFPGQGIVAETLNFSGLRGFATGGTIHIIVNNQVGFTTDPEDSRSTLYASDLAKGFEIPIVHVNADDPEACLAVARMALEYRQTFGHDFLIDLIGYRRWGHNEGDEPTFTQPQLYAEITSHATVRALLARELEAAGVIAAGDGERMVNAAIDALMTLKTVHDADASDADGPRMNGHHPGAALPGGEIPPLIVETSVPRDALLAYNDALHSFPEDFTLNAKLERQLQRRRGAAERPGGIDWAHAESLAFASILADGTPIRLTGQDVERGTFSQRHLVLHAPKTGHTDIALQRLPQAQASFAVYNSPLSEAGVLGFEYGYSVYAPDALVLWEAQFGDFANSAQVIIDQFIAAGQAKWRQASSFVLLLPHGYEGQGPEHSSGRLERFLQLAADGSLRVANCTTAAQYFHLLRRQAKLLTSDPRPLVVMTPKSLLRNPQAGASIDDFARGAFQTVIDDARVDKARVTRVVLCSGKVYYDVVGGDARQQADDVAVVRIEELHPFPSAELGRVLAAYPALSEIIWLQEEPRNMGAWGDVAPYVRELAGDTSVTYVGRPERASPAEGLADAHSEEQARIVAAAFSATRALQFNAD